MARRKTVREESRREVGTLDMAYSSTLSLLNDDDGGRFGSASAWLSVVDLFARRAEERGRLGGGGPRLL
jgi:hypothetical protein